MIYVLEIDDIVTKVLLGAKKETIFRYKDLSINIVSDVFMDIETSNGRISAGRKALNNCYLLYNDNQKTFIIIHKKDYDVIKDNLNYKLITIDDFSVVDNLIKQLKDFKQLKYKENSIITDNELKNKSLEEILYDK